MYDFNCNNVEEQKGCFNCSNGVEGFHLYYCDCQYTKTGTEADHHKYDFCCGYWSKKYKVEKENNYTDYEGEME